MAQITVPVRLASRARLLAADVAAAFAPLVAAINGGLSGENYAPGRAIANANKAQPRSVSVLQFVIAGGGVPVPVTTQYNQRMSARAPGATVEWSVTFASAPEALPTGVIRLLRDGVQVGTDHSVAGADFREAIVSAPVAGDALWTVEIAITVAGYLPDLSVLVAVKAPHVR
jgi:hypothetical protein